MFPVVEAGPPTEALRKDCGYGPVLTGRPCYWRRNARVARLQPRAIERGEHDRRKNADNRNDHQQLYECKPAFFIVLHTRYHTTTNFYNKRRDVDKITR